MNKPLSHMPIANTTCEDLYSGLGDCHDAVALLENYVVNAGNTPEALDHMYAVLKLLRYRLADLSLLVDPGVLARSTHADEVSHAQ